MLHTIYGSVQAISKEEGEQSLLVLRAFAQNILRLGAVKVYARWDQWEARYPLVGSVNFELVATGRMHADDIATAVSTLPFVEDAYTETAR